MAGGASAIRGTRVGSGPMGEQDHGHQAERVAITYWDGLGNEVVKYYSADIPDEEIPAIVDHPKSGLPAGRDKDNPPAPEKNEPYKTHLAYVKERRTDEEADGLLEEALQKLRDKRGA
ncbi:MULTISPECIES: RNA polymerase-binding protein RbpA [Microbacterium]|uniref:RNA polymerase-binding protein RbpA n=1 Tax=Microbacterium TaxID=33882 RepID=UPI0012B9120A|nr:MULTISPECIES: RNA polymerase-binding protein RbpA [Microbacterium]MTE23604.1 RNA polymerase-binding protein RbpA [Microbacterium sp. ZXX196]NHI16744.1 RNA polymerase-binding protein RbpA [Microbacterium excoecariae]